MPGKCLVVPTEKLISSGLIEGSYAGKVIFKKMSKTKTSLIYQIVEKYGKYRQRHGRGGVEKNPLFQQLIMYAFVLNGKKFLVYQRDTTGKHSDSRLSGKVSVGIGGHMDPTDLTLEDSLWRELDEEAEIVVDGSSAFFRNVKGQLNISLMKKLISIEPVGILKDGRDEVGMVHLGIICMIKPKKNNVEFRLKTGEEAAKFSFVTLSEYENMTADKSVVPEGWTEIVVNKVIKPALRHSL